MRQGLTAVVTSAAILALAGCISNPAPAHNPDGFESKAAAVDAALEVVDHYMAATTQSLSRAEDRLVPFEGVISADLMEAEVESREDDEAPQTFLDGTLGAFDVTVTQVELEAEYPTAFVRVRICLDYRSSRLVDAAGNDVTPDDRVPWRPVELALIADPDDPRRLLVDDFNSWVGYDFCPMPRERADLAAP